MSAASSANSISLTYTSVTFVLARRRARLNSFPSDLVCRSIPSEEESKAYDRRREKKIPNNVGARTQPCLIPLQTGKGSDADADAEDVGKPYHLSIPLTV